MKTPRTILAFLMVTAIALCSGLVYGQGATPSRQPNIVFFMFDDLGNADLGYRGSDIKTPTIDKLATGGVRLESFWANQ